MVNKKAYIRTIEAVIAIVLLLFATYTLAPKQVTDPRDKPYIIESAQEYVMKQVTQDEILRQMILDDPLEDGSPSETTRTELETNVIEKRLPSGYTYQIEICENPSCISEDPSGAETSVYMEDTIIAGKPTDGEPVIRLVRVWFWRE